MRILKHNMKRTIALTALTAVLLSGCASADKELILLDHDPGQDVAAGKTVVTFYGYKADAINLIAIENALNNFMQENTDFYVTYEGSKGTAYWNALELRSRTGNLDDIFMVNHEQILALGAEGKLADLSGLSTLDNYIPWTRSQFTDESGAVYFLPTCISTYNLYINTDLLQQHGQSIPTNLAEFTQVCDYFVGQGITPVIANNYASLSTVMISRTMYDVYGAEDSAAQVEGFNTGEADLVSRLRPGLEFVREMFDRGWMDGEEVLATNQTSGDLELFSQGDRPFMITGGWASVRLKVDFSYGVYPYPILEDGSVMAMNVDTCIAVNADSPRLEEAMELVEYLTQPDVMWAYCDSQCSYSPLTDNRIPSDETIAPSAPYLSNGRIVLGSDYNLDFPMENALMECGRMLAGGADVESAVETLSELLYSETEGGNAS